MHGVSYQVSKVHFLFLCFTLALLYSCGTKKDVDSPKVFHYNQHNNITSLDPAFAKSQNNIWAINHLYTTLVELGNDLNIQPALAKSWTISDDGLVYQFIIRNDVLFHDDECFATSEQRVVTAHDVVYSYRRLQDTILNAPGSWIFKNKVEEKQPFTAKNDSIFVVRLQKPFAPFLSLLTMQYCSILPEEAVNYYGDDFFKHPVGSGPFQIKTWIDNQGLFLIRNPSFFQWADGQYQSNLEGVRTSFISERSIAFLELINKRIDFFSGLESGYVNTALSPQGELLEQYEDIEFIKSPYLNFEYLGINPNAGGHPLLKEKAFRQALNYGINRKLMLASLRNNVGKPADAGVVTRGLPSYDPESVQGYNHNVAKANELLAGFSTEELRQELVVHTSKDYLDLTTYIAKQWEDLGLVVSIEVMESAALRGAMRKGEIPLFRASWIADYPDGESFLSMFYSQNPAPPNYTRFEDSVFDEVYEEALAATNPEHKISLYQSMDRLLVKEAPVIFLFYDEIALFTNKDVGGLSKNALNLLQVKNIQKN